MGRIGFCAGAYQSVNLSAAAQENMNFLCERNEVDDKSSVSLIPRPGLGALGAGIPSFTRGAIEINGRVFYASNDGNLYEINPLTGAQIQNWAIGTDQKPVSLAASATQLMIASAGQGYCLTMATNILTAAIATIAGVIQVAYSDGFFLALIASSQKWFVSTALDGTNWNAGNATVVSIFPSNVVVLCVDHREVAVLGGRQAGFYYDSGNLFPYDVIPGSFMELGSVSAFGWAKLDNSLFWWHQSERGGRMAWRAQAYSPIRISTHAIEAEVEKYSRVDDAISFAVEISGHTLFVTTFPTADKTWVYDVAAPPGSQWSRWTFFDGVQGLHHAFRGYGHVYSNGAHLIGDTKTGGIYQMSMPVPKNDGSGTWNFGDDFGNSIVRDRISPYQVNEGKYIPVAYAELEGDFGIGMNPAGGGPVQGVASFILQDANNALWTITVLDSGLLRSTAGGIGNPSTIILRDNQAGNTAWQLKITVGGLLQTTQISPVNSNYPTAYFMGSNPSGNQTAIEVLANGQLQTLNPAPIPKPPQAVLRWSDDRAKTWSNGRLLNLGTLGQYGVRVITRMLGRFWGTKGRVWRLTYSDKPPLRITDLYIDGAPDMVPTERLTHKLRQQA